MTANYGICEAVKVVHRSLNPLARPQSPHFGHHLELPKLESFVESPKKREEDSQRLARVLFKNAVFHARRIGK